MAEKDDSDGRRRTNREHGKKRGYPRVWAKPVIPGRTSMVTIKTDGGQMLLAPQDDYEEVGNFIGYCLGRALSISDALFHGLVAMGNHPHTLVTDVEGLLPKFKEVFHGLLAKGMNCKRGRHGGFWKRGGSCDTSRVDGDDTLADLVYILTNPVEAGLVKNGGRWPGFTTYGWKFGETRTFKRPAWFFDADTMPDEVSVTLTRPPVFEGRWTDEELFEELMRQTKTREKEIQARMREENRRFMGVKKLLRQKWGRAPDKPPELYGQQRRVAGTSRWQILAGLNRDRDWERRYAEARARYDANELRVEYPYGTYFMRVRAHVNVANAPP